jgi:hypothetical protein
MVADAFNDGSAAGVADAEALAGAAGGEEGAAGGAVEAGVAENHLAAGIVAAGRRHDGDAATIDPLAHVIVGFSNQPHRQTLEQEGNSVDRLVNDYSRQLGDYASLQQINQKLRERQYTRAQAGQVAQYLDRWNSQQFYEEQPYMDPLPPFAPLPTLVMPPPPSMTGAPPTRPSGGAYGLNIATGILGGIQTGIGVYQGMKGLNTPSSGSGPGTPGGGGLDLSGIRQYGG